MANYAIIDKAGEVINSVEWDGSPYWTPPEGCKAVAHPQACKGWKYNGKEFVPPAGFITVKVGRKPHLGAEDLLQLLLERKMLNADDVAVFTSKLMDNP